jgi:hypothetical protein
VNHHESWDLLTTKNSRIEVDLGSWRPSKGMDFRVLTRETGGFESGWDCTIQRRSDETTRVHQMG